MRYEFLLRSLFECPREDWVRVKQLAELVQLHHSGVGVVEVRYTEDFPSAPLGSFVWQQNDRSSPYDEPFGDVHISVNCTHRDDRKLRRLVAAKELMQVFDAPIARASSRETFITLISDIETSPVMADASAPYLADRVALWFATVALIPPWLRDPFKEQWAAKTISEEELSDEWAIPAAIARAAMSEYYDRWLNQIFPLANGRFWEA